MALRFICDICERPLPLEKINDVETAVRYSTTEWNTKSLYPCLCKTCAGKLDAAIKKVKDEAILSKLIAARNRKLNNERKARLRTNG